MSKLLLLIAKKLRTRLGGSLLAIAALAAMVTPVGAETPPIIGKVCAQCHGLDGNSALPAYPKLAGLQAGYIAKQINEFLAGNRAHELMAPVVSKLTLEEIERIAHYFSQQTPAPGVRGEPTLTEIGQLLYTIGNPATGLPSCDGCHGADATGGGRFPRLAGQHRDYILKQLNDIKAGRRNSSPLMRAVTDRMNALEMKALAVYLAGL